MWNGSLALALCLIRGRCLDSFGITVYRDPSDGSPTSTAATQRNMEVFYRFDDVSPHSHADGHIHEDLEKALGLEGSTAMPLEGG